jgi:flagellar basal body-associated protein FliL
MRKPKPDSSAAKTAEVGSSEVSKVKSVMNLDAFLVNLADQDATRFVKVTFRLGLDDPKSGEEYAGDPVILAATRDKIISILSTKMAEAILTPEGKEQLRKEICEKVNPVLPKGKIVEVFIMEFVVQL